MNTHFPAREFGRKNAADRLDDANELNQVMAALKARDAEIRSFAEKASAEIKANGAMATETKAALEKLSANGTELSDRLLAVEQKMARRAGAYEPDRKSLGQRFVDSDEFKALQKSGTGKARLNIKASTITEATADAAGSAGDLIVPDRRPGIVADPNRVMTIRNLLLPGRTASNAVEYARESGFTNAAATVGETDARAQSDLKFDFVSETVKTIGHFMVASKTVLSDAPMLQSYIDGRLRYGLAYKEETQLLTGDGAGDNLHGLLPQASLFQESTYSVGATDTRIDTIRRAVLQARIAEYRPSFVVLNPVDWAAIELTKDSQGRYLFVNIQVGATMVLWRLNVVETTAMNSGEFLVGAGMGAQIFDREDAAVEVSTDYSDFFVKNKAAILAEERLALAVTRPESFVYGQFDLGSSPSINL